jgi:hypothetical protein
MRTRWPWIAGLAVAGAFAAGTALSQDEGAPEEKKPKKESFVGADPRDQSPADIQRRMVEAMTPNRFHKALERFLGEWDVEYRMSMAPDKPPMVSKGRMSCTWLFEGKWIQADGAGSMMGMPMKTKVLLGYDNFKRKYVGATCDSLGTAMYTFEGNLGKDRETLFLYGAVDEYLTLEHDKTAAYVYRFDGPDRFTLEVHDLSIGIEGARVIEAVHTRRK